MLTYKEDPIEELAEIWLSMGCDYMSKYQGFIAQLVSSYVVLISLIL